MERLDARDGERAVHFALAVAERLFDGLVFGRAFLAAGFGFWDFAFALLSFSQRAFTAALILALAAERWGVS